jgi:ribonuclease HII
MCEYHQRDPRYRFHVHKGYPTPEHLRLLRQFGPSPLHRHSFGPVRRCLSREGV